MEPVILLLLLSSLSLTYAICLAVYRLFLCPVSQFPGPRLAALTFWYEFFYDVVLRGRYTWKIKELHEKYGPIIRINPEELHISDPSFYDDVYVNYATRPTDKWYWSARQFGTYQDTVSTVDHRIHRHRRAALNPLFSKKSIAALEPRVKSHVDKLIGRLKSLKGTGKPVNLIDSFVAFTTDVISDLTLGQPYGFLDQPNFNAGWHPFLMELSRNTHLMKQFSWAYSILEFLPRQVISLLDPFLIHQLHSLQDSISQSVHSHHAHHTTNDKESSPSHISSIISSLLSSPHLLPPDKNPSRLAEETFVLLGAGTTTTAWALAVTTYHILSNPHILTTLQSELCTLVQTTSPLPPLSSYSQLPYLSAVLNEGLRLSHGTSHRLARVSPYEDLEFNDYSIPAGTPVSMTQMHIHLDPVLFPDPDSFMPERWIAGPQNSEDAVRERKRYLVPFSKGARMCVGMHLAELELGGVVGRMFGGGGFGGADGNNEGCRLELVGTGVRDVRVEKDWFNPVPWEGSRGVRVLVK
ncbi:cytochrome P450 [Dendryphion nanum]|uniref:Cytochrome P450 n=1 Tax=Dendryphion nanum TaxID=256645 RepID=A0A9P9D9M2_9PLEO|nr:cytochrome P450 [Dendryphion nanum]